jgi:tRNA threonylcarbamoyladenosine biosynthesis protein TsaE
MYPINEGQLSVSTPYSVHCIDEAATASLVQILARAIRAFFLGAPASLITNSNMSPQPAPNLHLSLTGDLGAGKTTAVRYLLKELGYLGKIKSPTYSLCEEHRLTLTPNPSNSQSELQHTIDVYHFDFYRMQSPSEWLDAGLQEHFTQHDQSTICIVEWPEKALGTLPIMDMAIAIALGPSPENEGARTICFTANSPSGERLLSSIQGLSKDQSQS